MGRSAVLMAGVDDIPPAFSDNNIPVFFGCDANYFPHVPTLVASIMAHAAGDDKYDFLLFMSDIDEASLKAVREWMRRFDNARLRYIDVSRMAERMGAGTFRTNVAQTVATYFRLFAPEALAEHRKALYLDVDVVCLRNLADLFRQDLDGCLAGACEDVLLVSDSLTNERYGRYWSDNLKMTPGSFYFNAGVMLMDLAGMRAEDMAARAMEKVRSIPDLQNLDQDALNVVLSGRIKPLPECWNRYDWVNEKMADLDAAVQQRIIVPREEMGCLHFVGKKPWSREYLGENADLYWRYAAETPFCGDIWQGMSAGCSLAKMAFLYGKWSLQLLHNRMRHACASGAEKAKYADRVSSLSARKNGVRRHMWRVRKGNLA